MRLVTTRDIWRAFPELDHFSDEQCLAFVRAAGQARARNLVDELVRFASVAGVFVGVFVAPLSAFIRIMGNGRDANTTLAMGLMLSIWVIGLGATGLALLISRDFVLRRRIRSVMRLRGSCVGCGYGLTGLPVSEPATGSTQHAVTCPECGAIHDADAAFDEVVRDATGLARYVPSPAAAPRLERGMSKRIG